MTGDGGHAFPGGGAMLPEGDNVGGDGGGGDAAGESFTLDDKGGVGGALPAAARVAAGVGASDSGDVDGCCAGTNDANSTLLKGTLLNRLGTGTM